MKRTTYLLKDSWGNVQARMTQPEGESVSLEPWMIHNINGRGWRLEAWETSDSGVQIHGWVDWEAVASNMATVLRLLLDDEMDWNEDDADLILAQAQAALDDYQVALMEISVAQPEGAEEADDGSAQT